MIDRKRLPMPQALSPEIFISEEIDYTVEGLHSPLDALIGDYSEIKSRHVRAGSDERLSAIEGAYQTYLGRILSFMKQYNGGD